MLKAVEAVVVWDKKDGFEVAGSSTPAHSHESLGNNKYIPVHGTRLGLPWSSFSLGFYSGSN